MRLLPALALALTALVLSAAARADMELDELTDALDAEVAQHPDDAELRLQRARVHLLTGQWRAALAELDAAAEQGADRDIVATTRGRVFLEAGKARAARAEFDRVLRRRPDAYGTLFERGRAWLALGHTEQAAGDFGRALAALEAPRPEQVIARRDALLALGRREAAVRALDEGMARIGHVASLELAAIDLEVEMGRHAAALRRIERLLAATPENPAWVALRAELLRRSGRTHEAQADYARALSLLDAGPQGPAFEDLRRRLQTALAGDPRKGRR